MPQAPSLLSYGKIHRVLILFSLNLILPRLKLQIYKFWIGISVLFEPKFVSKRCEIIAFVKRVLKRGSEWTHKCSNHSPDVGCDS